MEDPKAAGVDVDVAIVREMSSAGLARLIGVRPESVWRWFYGSRPTRPSRRSIRRMEKLGIWEAVKLLMEERRGS